MDKEQKNKQLEYIHSHFKWLLIISPLIIIALVLSIFATKEISIIFNEIKQLKDFHK